jgi:hypothetical protein
MTTHLATHAPLADDLARLANDHFLQPFARVAQVLLFGVMLMRMLEQGVSRHEDHWGHAVLRPMGMGVAGLGVIEIAKLASGAALGGSLGF